MLQKGVAAAQGAEGIGWRDEAGMLQGTTQAVTILGGLLERLRRWEAARPDGDQRDAPLLTGRLPGGDDWQREKPAF